MRKIIFSLLVISISSWNNKPGKPIAAPAVFAPGIISTEDDEFGACFSNDGKACYFTLKSPSTISSSIYTICVSHFSNGHWNEPSIASFSGRYKDFNPSISPDGLKLFFISNRPVKEKKKNDPDIWYCNKKNDGWSEPINIGEPVNTVGWELGCSVAADGTLYYSSTGTTGNADLYCSKFINGKYQQPKRLGEQINTAASETDPFIAKDGSYLLFTSQGREDALTDSGASAAYPRSDLYISFNKNGVWTTAKNLGAPINSAAEESSPWVSADGKTFYFTSERNFISIPVNPALKWSYLEDHLHNTRNGLGDIYEMPFAKLLAQLNK